MINPVELAVMAGVAVLLFGAERLPKLARSMGEVKREFNRGQVEAEAEHQASVEAAKNALLNPPTEVEPKAHEPHSA